MPITILQQQDFLERLSSFKRHGLLPAAQAHKEFKKVITSSERLINPALCFNYVDLSSSTKRPDFIDSILKTLMSHDTHGFINMAIERHFFTECSDAAIFKQLVAERLFCSFIFIFNPQHTMSNKFSILRNNPLSPSISELMSTRGVEISQCFAVLVPEGLEHIVSTVFPDIKIYVAPLRKSTLNLSVFTLSSAITLKSGDPTLREINIPDYSFALKAFINQNPDIVRFGTHISRFSTTQCFSNPFRAFSSAEKAISQSEIQKRIMLLVFKGIPMEASCEFAIEDKPEQLNTPGVGRISFATLFYSPASQFSREIAHQIKEERMKMIPKELPIESSPECSISF